ncbi:MAG: helix-turn-helix transcriptional regulator [Faecalibacterium sp.]|nr:helix-turn-helix transcriptional regulator [Faecalibacterium sp.]
MQPAPYADRFLYDRPHRPVRGDAALAAEILQYLQQNYTKPLTLDAIAAQFFISKSQLTHVFRRRTGMSVHQHLTQLRLEQACRLLAEGQPPTGIYQSCGFGDYTNFYRAFKARYEVSPRQYQIDLNKHR